MIRSIFLALTACALLQGCDVRSLTGRNSQYDSLFLGVSLGMKAKDFYDHCWQLNKEKVVTHGPTNQSVEYAFDIEPGIKVYMRFYPYFYKDMIYQMPVTFTYDRWAPWARDYHADKLIEKIIPMLNNWYGGEFQSKVDPRKGRVYARIDGHRRMFVFVKDEQYVQLVITDIGAEKDYMEEVEEIKKKEKSGEE